MAVEEEEEDDGAGEPWYIDVHDLVLEPSRSADHRYTLVVLHSCSGGPDDFLPFFHRLDASLRGRVRAVVPCSPVRAETHDGWKKEQNSWFEYDDSSPDGNSLKYPSQLLEQRCRVLTLLENERARLPNGDARRLVLWGLSQGAALAVDAALHAPFAVGGVVALRGMALRGHLESLPSRPAGTPAVKLLAINGAYDGLCPPDVARATYEALAPHGLCVEYVTEPTLGHACARGRQRLHGPELRRVNGFLRRVWEAL